MKNTVKSFGSAALVLCFLLGTGGCRSASTPVSFYTLSPLSIPENNKQAYSGKAPVILVGPLTFPNYLERLQIVTRSAPGRIYFSDFNQWAAFLDKEFLKTVAENLSVLLSSPQVRVYPSSDDVEPDYRIALDVKQFEGNPGESVRLNVIWTLRCQKNGVPVRLTRRSVCVEPVSGDGYDALVLAHSRAVEKLCREIAAAIPNLEVSAAKETAH